MNQRKAKRLREEIMQAMKLEKIASPGRLYRVAKKLYNETLRPLRNTFTILKK